MLFVLMRYAAGRGNFIEDRSLRCSNVATACALRAALATGRRERGGRLWGACCGGSGNQRRSIDGGSDEAAAAGLLIYNRR